MSSSPAMKQRNITTEDLLTLDWNETPEGWKIVADLACARCGAYQAVDSDPAPVRGQQIGLALRLFNQVGWRVSENEGPLCPKCARPQPHDAPPQTDE